MKWFLGALTVGAALVLLYFVGQSFAQTLTVAAPVLIPILLLALRVTVRLVRAGSR